MSNKLHLAALLFSKRFRKLAAFLVFLTSSVLAQPDPTRPIVPMSQYEQDSRIMTCMQCFQAEGIMCYDKNQDFGRIWSWTRTEDPGYGICCQKNSKALACNTSFSFNENQCSEPVHDISMQPADPQK